MRRIVLLALLVGASACGGASPTPCDQSCIVELDATWSATASVVPQGETCAIRDIRTSSSCEPIGTLDDLLAIAAQLAAEQSAPATKTQEAE